MGERADVVGPPQTPEGLPIMSNTGQVEADFAPGHLMPSEPGVRPASTEGNEQPEQILQEIEQTRGEMTETVQAIQDKLGPRQLALQAKETARVRAQALSHQVKQQASAGVIQTRQALRQAPSVARQAATQAPATARQVVTQAPAYLQQVRTQAPATIQQARVQAQSGARQLMARLQRLRQERPAAFAALVAALAVGGFVLSRIIGAARQDRTDELREQGEEVVQSARRRTRRTVRALADAADDDGDADE